jgi:D-mannonate dehydratase
MADNPIINTSNIPQIVMYPGQVRPTDEHLRFTKQLGLDTVMVAGLPEDLQNVEGLLSIKKRYEDAGIKVYSVLGPIGMQPKEIVLNLPGRDELIEKYLNWIRTLAKAGFHYTNSGFMGGTGVWTTRQGGEATTRESATREFDESAPQLNKRRQKFGTAHLPKIGPELSESMNRPMGESIHAKKFWKTGPTYQESRARS